MLQIEPRPSAIIASGDFLDHPDPPVVVAALRKTLAKIPGQRKQPKSLAYVWEQLDQLRRECGETCRLLVVPGNHDCRMFGLISRKNQTAKFNKVFKDWGNSLLFLQDVRPVAIFCLDSNTNDARINAARGRVGKEEYNRFAREFEKLQRLNSEVFDNAFKIVVLHHHPLPIANAEEEGFFATDAFLGLDDAGVFMREMANRGIDLCYMVISITRSMRVLA
jgi:3',5'-cyclic AMP phosphodiesterase CpdA